MFLKRNKNLCTFEACSSSTSDSDSDFLESFLNDSMEQTHSFHLRGRIIKSKNGAADAYLKYEQRTPRGKGIKPRSHGVVAVAVTSKLLLFDTHELIFPHINNINFFLM